jgi:hypothetical protein
VVGHVSGEGLASAGHTDALARELDEMLARPLSSPVTGHVSLSHTPTRLTAQTKKTRGEKDIGISGHTKPQTGTTKTEQKRSSPYETSRCAQPCNDPTDTNMTIH